MNRKTTFKHGQKQEFVEFIGNELKVTSSSCRGLCGVVGRVVDETVNTFVLEIGSNRKRVAKKGSVFRINGREVKGDTLVGRPEDR
ncbi:ribonuclease P protein subunit [Candidatus Micrarchaeota archaeon]|nr:ribonuclease P protein subunit [Candidatus Micrarchaeota archaeon]